MNKQILEELKYIRKELQDIRSILEQEEKDSAKKTIDQLAASLEGSLKTCLAQSLK